MQEHGGRPGDVFGDLDAEEGAELVDDHHRADATREAGDDRVGNLADVTAELEDAEDHQKHSGDQGDFGTAGKALLAHGGGQKRKGNR